MVKCMLRICKACIFYLTSILYRYTGYSWRKMQVFQEEKLRRNRAVQIVHNHIWNRVSCWTSCAILVTTPGKPTGLHCNRDSRLLLTVTRSAAVMTCWENCSCHFCIHFWHSQQSCLYGLTKGSKSTWTKQQEQQQRQKAWYVNDGFCALLFTNTIVSFFPLMTHFAPIHVKTFLFVCNSKKSDLNKRDVKPPCKRYRAAAHTFHIARQNKGWKISAWKQQRWSKASDATLTASQKSSWLN